VAIKATIGSHLHYDTNKIHASSQHRTYGGVPR
jgi:hypothetical protein